MISALKSNSKTLLENLIDFMNPARKKGLLRQPAADEPPLRSELFGAIQMEQHGKFLAGTHQLSQARAQNQLLSRLGTKGTM